MFLMAWVHAAANKCLITVQDRAGKRGTTGFWVAPAATLPTDTAPAALTSALQGVCDGAVTKTEILQYAVQDAPAAVPANVFKGSDKVRLHFADALGVKGTIQLGAIKPAHLLPDGVTLKPGYGTGADAAVTALYDALKAAGSTAEGGDIAIFYPAKRMRNARIKKQ